MNTRPLLILLVALPLHAVELVKWERIPLPVALNIGQERIVFVDRNVRVGYPAALEGKLRIQSSNGTLYLLASQSFAATRLQLQDTENGELILLDVSASKGEHIREPMRIVREEKKTPDAKSDAVPEPLPSTPLPVALTRYGYFEIRTRFLSGSGLAPAFWFLGMQDAAYTENMEVDSPEVFTLENVVKFNLLPRQGEASQSLVTAYGEGATLPDLDDGYHIYGLEWDPEYLKLYIDGQLVSTIETEIDYRMFPLISLNHHETNNTEVGNIYDNDPPLPNDETFTIDYYRVFKKADTPAAPWPNYQNPLLPG